MYESVCTDGHQIKSVFADAHSGCALLCIHDPVFACKRASVHSRVTDGYTGPVVATNEFSVSFGGKRKRSNGFQRACLL